MFLYNICHLLCVACCMLYAVRLYAVCCMLYDSEVVVVVVVGGECWVLECIVFSFQV